jgi:hypothetical protein
MRSSLALAAAFGALAVSPAAAGGYCHANCAPVEPVHVRPAYTEFVHSPAVMGTRVQRVETSPGYWTATKHPAQYGFYQKSVVARPAQVRYSVVPARYETRHETVVVRAAHVRYEMRADKWGRMVKCAVEVPAVTQTVARRVMVSPAHTVAHTSPAQYRTVTMQTQLAPARVSYQYTHPTVGYVSHPVMLKGPSVQAIHHPARVMPARRAFWH